MEKDEIGLTPREEAFLSQNPGAEMIPSESELRGVAGWLGFLVASLLVLGPILTVALTALEMEDTKSLYPEITGTHLWDMAQRITWASVAATCVIMAFAGWRLLKLDKASSVIIAIICLWLAGPVVGLVSLAALDDAGADVNSADVGAAMGRPFVWATIWTVYLLISRRVRNTYLDGNSVRKAIGLTWSTGGRRARQMIFLSLAWIVLSFLYFQLIDPVEKYWDEREVRRMWTIILLPPVLLTVGTWSYRRFVGAEN